MSEAHDILKMPVHEWLLWEYQRIMEESPYPIKEIRAVLTPEQYHRFRRELPAMELYANDRMRVDSRFIKWNGIWICCYHKTLRCYVEEMV
jgi:hypothetical protein